MLYSIQGEGEVYGTWHMEPVEQSAEVWAAELREELKDILGRDGVRDVPLASRTEDGRTRKVPRVVIDIEPVHSRIDERIEQIHDTISRLALDKALRAP